MSRARYSVARPALRLCAGLLATLAACGCGAARPAEPGHTELNVGGAHIEVQFDPADFQAGRAVLVEWVRRSAGIVSAYYGVFPVRQVTIHMHARPGEGVHGGETFGQPQALIRIGVGTEVTAAELMNDWVMVHEMTHLALPDVGDEHAWLSEGLATYVEGVERVQAGNRTEEDVWEEELRSMPKGMPQPADAGLDHTHTWGRTYWGGAMFCLMADVEIHQRTHNRKGLQDALRAIAHASGGLGTDWPIERVLRTGDEAVGLTTLEDLYARMKDTPVAPDLAGLWHALGVDPADSGVRLTDAAPLAAVRHAIMSGNKNRS